jgi:hypothetical protein
MVKHGINFKLAPLKISQKDLLVILKKVHILIKSANQSSEEPYEREHLLISESGITFNQEGELDFSIPLSTINVAYAVNYSYNSAKVAPINFVNIELNPFLRRVSIEGTSQEHIEALGAQIRQSFAGHTIFIGGSRGNLMIGMFLIIVLYLLLFMLGKKFGPFSSQLIFLFSCIIGIVSAIVVWIDFFPGFAVYKTDVSFIVRNAALISFLSLIATIIFFILGIYINLLYSKP